jgi:anthranilate phosphoribosyltransferase
MIKEAIATLVDRGSLKVEEAASVMAEIMEGRTTPAQLSAFMVALKMKGETTEEITGLARTMRGKAVQVKIGRPVIDIVGTGGDGADTFNISTAAALVVAGAGLAVAKHGNRAATSRCGSADVLEALGVRLELSSDQAVRCLEATGITFMFAPAFHPAMKYAGPTRRELGVPSVFNILGPLTNPAGAERYLLGVARADLMEKMALVLKNLGARHALVVHGEDGLDEITVTGESLICELRDGWLNTYSVTPEEYGLSRAGLAELKGGTAAENAAALRSVLEGQPGSRRDIVLLNAAAALVAGDTTASLGEGLTLARETVDSGRALAKLCEFVNFTRSLA